MRCTVPDAQGNQRNRMTDLGLGPTVASEQKRIAVRIAMTYFVVSLLWICLSDAAVMFLRIGNGTGLLISIAKGTCFVLVTALLIYWLVRHGFRILTQNT